MIRIVLFFLWTAI